jgi:hypothetical protein
MKSEPAALPLPLRVAPAAVPGWVRVPPPGWVLRLLRARALDDSSAPALSRLVAELAADAGLPPPSVALVERPTPAGCVLRLRQRQVLVVSSGLLARLDDAELRRWITHALHRGTGAGAGGPRVTPRALREGLVAIWRRSSGFRPRR